MLTEIKDTEAVIMAAAAGGNAEMDDMLKQFIGSKVSLITQSKLRWEGTLYNIDKTDSSIILQNGELPGLDNEQTDTRWLTFPPPPSAHTHVRTRAYHFVPCTGGEPVLSSPVLDERSNPCSESRGLLIAISNGGRKGYWGAIMCILRSRSLLVRPFSFCRQMD